LDVCLKAPIVNQVPLNCLGFGEITGKFSLILLKGPD